MNRIFNISEALCIGLHAMVYLAKHYPESKPVKHLATKVNASEAHLSKVCQSLQKAGLLASERGPKGGYKLAKPPYQITLLDIFETLNGKIVEHFCLYPKPVCKGEDCILGDLIKDVTVLIKNYLANTTLEDVKQVF